MSSGVRCADPSREDMVAFLALPSRFGLALEAEDGAYDFDSEEAVYWFSSDWYSGQWSNLYRALSASPFRPGILSDGPEPGSFAEDMYDALVREYVNGEA